MTFRFSENVELTPEIISGLYNQYIDEVGHFDYLTPMPSRNFSDHILKILSDCDNVAAYENGKVIGFFSYDPSEAGSCYIPPFGYFGNPIGVTDRLFQLVAEKLVKEHNCEFNVGVFAHDSESLRLFSLLQFGIMSETEISSVYRSEYASPSGFSLKTLTKDELEKNWRSVWKMTAAVIDHLKKSPVFYPGEEFTEELYKDFYFDENTAVHTAENKNGELVGMIRSSREKLFTAFSDSAASGFGEAYVIDDLRGSGLAAELLSFAKHYEADRGSRFFWVEHGTTNPNARNFWSKHFDPFIFCMTRTIKHL